jgi:predicted RNase H-like HicB family nuclease
MLPIVAAAPDAKWAGSPHSCSHASHRRDARAAEIKAQRPALTAWMPHIRGLCLCLVSPPREFEYVLKRQSNGGFLIYVPELPGLAIEASTREEAIAMLRYAITGYLENVDAHDLPLPQIERGIVVSA